MEVRLDVPPRRLAEARDAATELDSHLGDAVAQVTANGDLVGAGDQPLGLSEDAVWAAGYDDLVLDWPKGSLTRGPRLASQYVRAHVDRRFESCLVCIARAEHVIASDVWITFHGEEFKKREADELRPSGKRASAEQRWRLSQQTDGDRWPWLFFGIRSHRLLVAALRRKGVRRFALLALRFASLNWFFPLWTGSLLLAVAPAHHGGWTQSLLALTPVVLCVNTSGTLVGAVFAAFTMGGVARHHDSAGVTEPS